MMEGVVFAAVTLVAVVAYVAYMVAWFNARKGGR